MPMRTGIELLCIFQVIDFLVCLAIINQAISLSWKTTSGAVSSMVYYVMAGSNIGFGIVILYKFVQFIRNKDYDLDTSKFR